MILSAACVFFILNFQHLWIFRTSFVFQVDHIACHGMELEFHDDFHLIPSLCMLLPYTQSGGRSRAKRETPFFPPSEHPTLASLSYRV